MTTPDISTQSIESKPTRKPIIIIGVAALVVLLIGLGAVGLMRQASDKRPAPGAKAPDFSLGLYENYTAGLPNKIQLSQLQGKVVVVNFWASWCIPCKDEAPALQAIHDKYADRNVVMLGVNYLDTDKEALAFLSTYGVSYANGIDLKQQIAHQYRITGVPETFVVDKKGLVREVYIQPITERQLSDVVDRLLAED